MTCWLLIGCGVLLGQGRSIAQICGSLSETGRKKNKKQTNIRFGFGLVCWYVIVLMKHLLNKNGTNVSR